MWFLGKRFSSYAVPPEQPHTNGCNQRIKTLSVTNMLKLYVHWMAYKTMDTWSQNASEFFKIAHHKLLHLHCFLKIASEK
jgi:hypothetical protein